MEITLQCPTVLDFFMTVWPESDQTGHTLLVLKAVFQTPLSLCLTISKCIVLTRKFPGMQSWISNWSRSTKMCDRRTDGLTDGLTMEKRSLWSISLFAKCTEAPVHRQILFLIFQTHHKSIYIPVFLYIVLVPINCRPRITRSNTM